MPPRAFVVYQDEPVAAAAAKRRHANATTVSASTSGSPTTLKISGENENIDPVTGLHAGAMDRETHPLPQFAHLPRPLYAYCILQQNIDSVFPYLIGVPPRFLRSVLEKVSPSVLHAIMNTRRWPTQQGRPSHYLGVTVPTDISTFAASHLLTIRSGRGDYGMCLVHHEVIAAYCANFLLPAGSPEATNVLRTPGTSAFNARHHRPTTEYDTLTRAWYERLLCSCLVDWIHNTIVLRCIREGTSSAAEGIYLCSPFRSRRDQASDIGRLGRFPLTQIWNYLSNDGDDVHQLHHCCDADKKHCPPSFPSLHQHSRHYDHADLRAFIVSATFSIRLSSLCPFI